MAVNIASYSLRLVREQGIRYEFEGCLGSLIHTPRDLVNIANRLLEIENQAEELFAIICVDTKHKVTGVFEVSRGHLNSTLVHPREIFKRAILNNAAAICLLHNHPSGNVMPSEDDINITKRVVDAGNLLGIQVLDHLIVGERGSYSSLREKGHI